MDLESVRLATSPEGLALIDSLPPYGELEPLVVAERLRSEGVDSALVSVALTQARLRAVAAAKFGEFARGMLFTQAGLEQSTRLAVAARHADRFREAGIERVADLTAGIGADAMAMAALDLGVIAFEIDEATALIADHNLRHWPDAAVVHADSLATLARGDIDAQGAFADPARRTARGRRHDPRDYSPPLDAVIALRERFPALGIKLGPAVAHEDLPASIPKSPVEAQWVSVDGDVVEAALWFGPLVRSEGHCAMVIRDNTAFELTGTTEHATAGPLGTHVIEPDGAVIRSGLVGELAARIGARLMDPTIAYLTGEELIPTPFGQTFRIVEQLPYSERTLAAALRARGVGTLEIKKRGMDIAPEALRGRLKLKGDASATVILTRALGKRVALIVERVSAT